MKLLTHIIDRWLRSSHSTSQAVALGLLTLVIGVVCFPQVKQKVDRERSTRELQRRLAEAANAYTRFDENVRDAGKVAITLTLPRRLREGAEIPIKAVLKNRSLERVSLLTPGDGSWDDRDVTPHLELQFRTVNKKEWTPLESGLIGCANADMPDDSAVKVLAPGQSLQISHSLDYLTAGRYRVRLRYVNDPNTIRFDWPERYMSSIRRSTPCNVASEPVDLEIIPVGK